MITISDLPNTHAVQFAEVIARRRKSLRLTQSDVAFAVGTDRRVISRLERGIGTVRLEVALAVADSLGLEWMPREAEE